MIFVFRLPGAPAGATQLSFRTRQSLSVRLGDCDVDAFLYRFTLQPGLIVDHSNLPVLGTVKSDPPWVLAYGDPGFAFDLSVNGQQLTGTVPQNEEPLAAKAPGARLLVMNRDLARRTWFVDGTVYLGPKYVGAVGRDGRPNIVPVPLRSAIRQIGPDGKLVEKTVVEPPTPPPLPLLLGWRSWSALSQIVGAAGAWKDASRDGTFALPESLGYTHGYMIYRTAIHARKKGEASVLFTQAADRLHVFVNGQFVTTWGRGEGAQSGVALLPLEEGENELHVLVDNMGRFNTSYRHLGEHKGITGEIYVAARELRLSNVSWKLKDIARRQHLSTWEMANWLGKGPFMARLPEIQKSLKSGVPNQPAVSMSAAFRLEEGSGALLSLREAYTVVLVVVNGELVQQHFGRQDGGFADLRLDHYVHAGLNDLVLQFVGLTEPPGSEVSIRLFSFRKANRLTTNWEMRPFQPPIEMPQEPTMHRVAERMSCYRVTFKMAPPPRPVYVELAGLGKGQLYFNGHNLGRYWHIESPHRYYLPEPYFRNADTLNELAAFEEMEGFRPQDVRLLYAVSPYTEERY